MANSAECVGCGYCCRKAPCVLGFVLYNAGPPCRGLRWDPVAERYWCGPVLDESQEKRSLLEDRLDIGAGCCSNLNSDRREMKMRRKMTENHAAARLIERTDVSLSLFELKERLEKGDVEYLARQSVTRSLCRTRDPVVYMIVNRKRKSIITVLTPEQAVLKMQEMGRVFVDVAPSAEK